MMDKFVGHPNCWLRAILNYIFYYKKVANNLENP